MQVQTAGRRFDKPTSDRFFAQALEAVRRVPGVTAAAFTSQLPLSGDSAEYGVLFESRPDDKRAGRAAGIPLRRESWLHRSDSDSAPPRAASRYARRCLHRGVAAHQRIRCEEVLRRRPHRPADSRRLDGEAVVHHRRRRRRRETDVALRRPLRRGLRHSGAVGLRGQSDVARRSRPRRRRERSRPPSGRRSGRWTRTSRSCASRRWTRWSPRPQPSGVSR